MKRTTEKDGVPLKKKKKKKSVANNKVSAF